MVEKDDWRLQGQEDYLAGVTLFWKKWKAQSLTWDHDHCEFCWEKFSEFPETLHEGYTTKDDKHWICPECFSDFKDMYQWTVDNGEE